MKTIIFYEFLGGFTFTLLSTVFLYFKQKKWFNKNIDKLSLEFEDGEEIREYCKKYFGAPLVFGILTGLTLWLPITFGNIFWQSPKATFALFNNARNILGGLIILALVFHALKEYINYFMSFVLVTNRYVYLRTFSVTDELSNIRELSSINKIESSEVDEILLASGFMDRIIKIKCKNGKSYSLRSINNPKEIARAIDPNICKTVGF